MPLTSKRTAPSDCQEASQCNKAPRGSTRLPWCCWSCKRFFEVFLKFCSTEFYLCVWYTLRTFVHAQLKCRPGVCRQIELWLHKFNIWPLVRSFLRQNVTECPFERTFQLFVYFHPVQHPLVLGLFNDLFAKTRVALLLPKNIPDSCFVRELEAVAVVVFPSVVSVPLASRQ